MSKPTKKKSVIVPILGGCLIALFATGAEAAPNFFMEGLTRIDSHEHGTTAFYYEGSKTKADSLTAKKDAPKFLQEGLARVDNHPYGATAFYQ